MQVLHSISNATPDGAAASRLRSLESSEQDYYLYPMLEPSFNDF